MLALVTTRRRRRRTQRSRNHREPVAKLLDPLARGRVFVRTRRYTATRVRGGAVRQSEEAQVRLVPSAGGRWLEEDRAYATLVPVPGREGSGPPLPAPDGRARLLDEDRDRRRGRSVPAHQQRCCVGQPSGDSSRSRSASCTGTASTSCCPLGWTVVPDVTDPFLGDARRRGPSSCRSLKPLPGGALPHDGPAGSNSSAASSSFQRTKTGAR